MQTLLAAFINQSSHWFGMSQWLLPGDHDYHKLPLLFERIAREKNLRNELAVTHHQLVADWHALNRTYCELFKEYRTLRRYFSVSVSVPYTDVWTHKPVQFNLGKHPCEKPAEMLRQIITASSRPGDVVADFFMG